MVVRFGKLFDEAIRLNEGTQDLHRIRPFFLNARSDIQPIHHVEDVIATVRCFAVALAVWVVSLGNDLPW